MSTTPIRRSRYITMPNDDVQPQTRPRAQSATVIPFGIARQRLRGVKASRDMRYDLASSPEPPTA